MGRQVDGFARGHGRPVDDDNARGATNVILPESKKTFHLYQAKFVKDILETPGHILLESPTGSGKTLMAVSATAMAQAEGVAPHVVIIAPQKQIEHGFTECNGMVVGFPRGNFHKPSFRVPADAIRSPVGGRRSICRQVIDYLETKAPGYALAISHAAATTLLRQHGAERLPRNLAGATLMVDEAHHAPADGLNSFADAWEERGGRLVYFTATPHRGDGRKVARPNMTRLVRSLGEHMQSGLAPSKIASEIVPFGSKGDKVTAAEYSGEAVSRDGRQQRQLVNAILGKWEAEDRPKTIIKVPVMSGGSGPVVAALVKKFRKAGARVHDATGLGKAKQDHFKAILAAERTLSYAESQYDVVIGIQRVVEGTDWIHCSDVYCVGVPGNLGTAIQLLGRATRKKGEGHPRADVAKLTFFVPTAGGDSLDQLSFEHSRHTVMLCVFLADHEVGEQWIVAAEIRKGLGGGPIDVVPPAAEPDIAPETYAEIKVHMAAALEGKPDATIGDLIDAARKAMPGVEEADLNYVAVHVLAGDKPAVRKKIRKKFAERVDLPPEIQEEKREVFEEIVREFRDTQLAGTSSLKLLAGQTHVMNGGGIRKIADRFREAKSTPLTEEMILRWVKEWHEREGRYPTKRSGEIPGSGGVTWVAIDANLRVGCRGWPGGSSLARFVAKHFDIRNATNLPELTEEMIVGWVNEWHDREHKWPDAASGEIPGSGGETWSAINRALRSGCRNIVGGSSLSKFIGKHFNIRNSGNAPNLSIDMIKRWISEWYSRNGEYPTCNSGEIPGSGGEKWKHVSVYLNSGRRGLPGGSSIGRLVAEHFGERNSTNTPPLSVEVIKKWVSEWHETKGKWPTAASGKIPGSGGENWRNIDSILRNGGRDMPGGSSVGRFVSEHFGVRNLSNLPPLTSGQVIQWIKEWRKRNSEWPRPNSGEIPNSGGETWGSVNEALRNRRGKGRGLPPGGSSLTKFIAEHFPESRKPSTGTPAVNVPTSSPKPSTEPKESSTDERQPQPRRKRKSESRHARDVA